MKKKLLKIVVGGLTTISLVLCFINVGATELENFSPTNGTQTLPLKTWDDINEPNDLLGVTLLFNDIIKPNALQYNAEQGIIDITYTYNSDEYILESKPYIWGCDFSGSLFKHEITLGNSILNIREEYYANHPLTIFSNNIEVYRLYDMEYGYNLTNITWSSVWQYGPRLISFPLDQRDSEEIQLELIVTGRDYSPSYFTPWEALYAFLYENTTIVYSSQMASDLLTLDQIHSYNEGFNDGYDYGYEIGYDSGLIAGNDSNYRFTFLTGVLNGVGDLLAIEIFPNVQIGYFVFIPLALGITGMIFWFWRKD